MEEKSKKINYFIIAIGLLTAVIAFIYIKQIAVFLDFKYQGYFGFSMRKFLVSKNLLFLLVAIIIHLGVAISLSLKFKIPILNRKNIKASLSLIVLIYTVLGLLSGLTWYISFINPIPFLIIYSLIFRRIYSVSIAEPLLISLLFQVFFLAIALIFGDLQKLFFNYTDLIWIVCLTVIFPFFTQSQKTVLQENFQLLQDDT